jgi:hypothetical protein
VSGAGEGHHRHVEFAPAVGKWTAIGPYGGGRVPNCAPGGVNRSSVDGVSGNSSSDIYCRRETIVGAVVLRRLANAGNHLLFSYRVPRTSRRSHQSEFRDRRRSGGNSQAWRRRTVLAPPFCGGRKGGRCTCAVRSLLNGRDRLIGYPFVSFNPSGRI